MERKSVIVVRWSSNGKWEVYSSLVAFCATHPHYKTGTIYRRWEKRVYVDHVLELRRVPFRMNPYMTRRGGHKRAKPGPKGPRTTRR